MIQTILRRTEKANGEFIRTPAGEWALPGWFDKKPVPRVALRDKEEVATDTSEATADAKVSA